MIDITYAHHGLFTTFFAESKEGENILNKMLTETGTNKFFKVHSKDIISQIRKAGYVVRKEKKNNQTIDEILDQLGKLK